MCIRFSKSQDECDVLSYLANVVGNAAVAIVGSTAVATIAYVALNALGYEAITGAALAVVVPYIPVALTAPVAMTACAFVPLVVGIVVAAALTAMIISLASNRSDPKQDPEEELI